MLLFWQQRECFFDVSSEIYYDSTKRDTAEKEIADKIQLGVSLLHKVDFEESPFTLASFEQAVTSLLGLFEVISVDIALLDQELVPVCDKFSA